MKVGRDGRVTFGSAEQAFVHVIGPLPGVVARKGNFSMIRDGGGPIRWLLAYSGRLTPKQLAAVIAVIRGPSVPAARDTPDDPPADYPKWKAVLDEAIARVGAALGHKLGAKISLTLSDTPSGTAYAAQGPLNASGGKTGAVDTCYFTIYPSLRKLGPDSDQAKDTLSHESLHCYAAEIEGLDHWYPNPDWIEEGSAKWVGLQISQVWTGHKRTSSWWSTYLTTPGTSLFTRSYDAVGFFAHVAESGVSPWTILPSMFVAKTSTDAFDIAATASFLHTWASTYAREPDLGTGWEVTGPGLDGITARYFPDISPIGIGDEAEVAAKSETNALRLLELEADLVILRVSPVGAGVGRLRASDGSERLLRDAVYCTRPGGCACPPGSPGAGGTPPPRLPPGMTWVALTGFKAANTIVHLSGEKLARHCAKPVPKPPAKEVVFSGSVSGRFTKPGDCSKFPTPSYTSYKAILTTDVGGKLYFLQISLGYSSEPGMYKTGHGNDRAEVVFTNAHGNYWSTTYYPEGGSAGTFTVNPGLTSGTVGVTMINPNGGSVSAKGAWSCTF